MTVSAPAPDRVAIEAVTTFFGVPAGDIEVLSAGKVAIAGLYCDHFGEAAPGARFAARQVRYASRPPFGFNRPRDLGGDVIDVGDLNVFPLEPDRTEAILTRQVERLVGCGAKLLVVGGDYSLTPALVGGVIAGRAGHGFGMIRISSRLDTAPVEPGTPLSRHCAATRLAALLHDGPGALLNLGVSGDQPVHMNSDKASRAALSARRIAADIRSVPRFIEAPLRRATAIYLSVDIDVLEPSRLSSGSSRSGTGLNVEQLLSLLNSLRGLPIVAADLHGFVPDLGLSGRATTSLVSELGQAIVDVLRAGGSGCR